MSRTTRYTATSTGLALMAALVLMGCQSTPSSPTPTPTATVTTEPTPTETPETPEETAVRLSEKAVKEYFAVSDTALRSPDTFNTEDFKKVAIGTALADRENVFSALVTQGLHQIGSTKVESITDPRVNLENNLDLTPPQVPIVEFNVCYDVSELNVVDAEGKSITPADRKPRGVFRVGVANYEYPEGPWLVAFTELLEEETC